MSELQEGSKTASTAIPESDNCQFIGNIILIFSVVLTIVYIVAFGKVETVRYSEYAGMIKESSWSIAQIIMGFSISIGGLIWWYLFQKIGSILKYLEKNK